MTVNVAAVPTLREATPASVAEVRESLLLRASRLGLYLTAGALPLYTVRWHYGPLPTTLLETLILFTVATYVVARFGEGVRRPVATAYDIPIVLLLVAGAISVVVASDHRGAIGLYRAYFLEPVALFYVAIDVLRRDDDLKRLIVALAIGSSAFALLNVIVFYQALAANNVHVGYAPNALYGDANYVAMYMEPPFALAAALLLLGHGWRWKLAGAVWLAFTGTALAVSFSKGAYMAIVVLAVVVILTVPRWRWVVSLALVVAFAIMTQVPLMMARLATVVISFDGRQEIYTATLQMLRQTPIFGVGLGGYTYAFHGLTPEVYPHEIWLTFWVETGILGMVAFGVILFMLLWRGWRAWPRAHGFERVVLWGALGALGLWLVHGFVDSPYWKNDMSAEFWILASLQVVTLRAVRRS